MSDPSFIETLSNAPATFAGHIIAAERIRLSCGSRHHLHEYPHAAGADIEKLGRKPYTIAITANFHDNIPGAAYVNYYPNVLNALRRLFEQETTDDLFVPTVGVFKAYCTNWSQELDYRIRSGEKTEFEFLEDEDQATLGETLGNTAAALGANLDLFNAELALAAFNAQELLPNPNIFDQITNAANTVLAYRDQAGIYDNLIASKISALNDLIGEADRSNLGLQSADNFRTLEALKDLWASTIEFASDLALTRTPVQLYKVPRLMSVSEIASAIYGNSTRTMDILQLNDFDDVFAIRANTNVQYYADVV